jgi:hypothetical protein
MALTTGTVTLLFTDVEGSASLWESAPDAMQVPLRRHDEMLRSAHLVAPTLRWSTKSRRDDSDPCGSWVVMALPFAESRPESVRWRKRRPIQRGIWRSTGLAHRERTEVNPE